jgi:maltose O-acetyltransferase
MADSPGFRPVEDDPDAEPSNLDLMLGGQSYDPTDPELELLRERARRFLKELAATDSEGPERIRIVYSLFDLIGPDANVHPNLDVTYGRHVSAGERLTIGPGCSLLDSARITFGDRVVLSAGVLIQTETRPLQAQSRAEGILRARPVEIGDDCWIGSRAVIMPGVTIGAGTVIGPGAVVTRDVEGGVLAAGNPCQVIKKL